MSSLKQKAISSGKWTAVSSVVVTLCQFAQTIVLARYLSAGEFGVYGMATLSISLFRTVADGGMGNAIIYKQTTNRKLLSSIHWINLLLACLITLLIVLSATPLSWFFRESEMRPVVMVLAFEPLISAFTIVIRSVLRKELRFGALAFIQASRSLVNVGVAIALAMQGFGVFSIAYAFLAGSAVDLFLMLALAVPYSRPRWEFSRDGLSEYLRFGGFQIGEGFMNFLSANADYLMVASILGKDALGLYRIAYELVITPMSKISPIITTVAFPAVAKLKEPQKLKSAYLAITKLIATVTLPCLVGLWAVAPVFVAYAFDARYQSIATLVRILIVVGVLKTVSNPTGVVILARGRPDIGFFWNLFVLLTSLPVFYVAAQYGVVAVCIAYASYTSITFCILCGPIMSHLIGTNFYTIIRQFISPLAASALMGGVVCGISLLLSNAAPIQALPILIAAGVIAYVGLVMAYDRHYIMDIIALVRGRAST